MGPRRDLDASAPTPRPPKPISFLDGFERTARLRFEFVSRDLEEEALRWLRERDEREYSFVDATSFAVMRSLRINEALAFDGRLRRGRLQRASRSDRVMPNAPAPEQLLPAQAHESGCLLLRPRGDLAAPGAALGATALDQFLEPLEIAAHAPLVEADG